MNYLNEIPEELIRMYVGTILYKANIQTNANTCWAIIKQNWTMHNTLKVATYNTNK